MKRFDVKIFITHFQSKPNNFSNYYAVQKSPSNIRLGKVVPRVHKANERKEKKTNKE